MHFTPGDLLVAEPFLQDPNFKRSVVLICEHNENGTFGLVMNNAITFTLSEVLPDFPDIKAPLFEGGPVAVDTIHFIHNYPELEDSKFLRKDLYWSGNYEHLKLMADKGLVDLQKIRFFIGYSGWGAGQLLEEMKHSSWIICHDFKDYLVESNELWRKVLSHMGGQYNIVANYPEDPELN